MVANWPGSALTRASLAAWSSAAVGGRGGDGVEFSEELVRGRGRDVGADQRAGEEGAALALGLKRGKGAVSVAVRLAQVHVEPRAERAAEGVVHSLDRLEVGVGGGHTQAPGHERGLG